MRDINSPLQKSYYTALTGNLPHPSGTGQVKVYEGEEPDNEEADLYVVITGINSFDTSTKSSSDVNAQVQITVNSWRIKYNNRKYLNQVVDDIIQILKPTPNAVLYMAAYDIQMLNLSLTQNNERDYGKLAGRVFVSRDLIFNQDLFIK